MLFNTLLLACCCFGDAVYALLGLKETSQIQIPLWQVRRSWFTYGEEIDSSICYNGYIQYSVVTNNDSATKIIEMIYLVLNIHKLLIR